MTSTEFKIVYVFQGSGIDMTEDKAAQVHMYHVIQKLQEHNHLVVFVTPYGKQIICTEDLTGFRERKDVDEHVVGLPITSSKLFTIAESIIRRLQRILKLPYLALFDSMRTYEGVRLNGDADLLYERFNLMCAGAAIASRQLNIPYVVEFNGDMIQEYDFIGQPIRGLRRKFAVWATKLVISSARAFICPTQGLADHFIDKWGVPHDRMFVIPNAADVDAFASVGNLAKLRQRLGLSETAPVVMFVGGFYPWHGLDVLVDAFALVVNCVPEARLLLVGDGRVRPKIETHIAAHGLREQVILTGHVPHKELPGLMALASVVVVSGRETGWGIAPLKLFEYMAAGKAIVASKIAGITDIVEDGESAMLVEPEDEKTLAEAIIVLLQNPDLQAYLGENACHLARTKHSWEQHVKELERVYEVVLNAKGADR